MMRGLLRAIAVCSALLSLPAWSATYWVGSSAACTGPNVHPNLAAALFAASIAGGADEIRLTNTLSYSGPGGRVTLTDWSASAAGALTISGGYPDCFTSPSGRTSFGNTTGTSITVRTVSQAESVVTLRRLDINNAETGLVATGGAAVTLDDVRIGDHELRGMLVDGGAFVNIGANTIVEDNGSRFTGTDWGGGVYCNGSGSEVTLRGQVYRNSAVRGSNVYLANGCFLMAMGGASIGKDGEFSSQADEGGGIYIDNGGEFFANGGSQRVMLTSNRAVWGAGLYVRGSGRATLVNAYFKGNIGLFGAAIYAVDGGTSGPAQVTMDRASSCPFLISCSEIEGNQSDNAVVYVDNSYVRISRTLIELNGTFTIIPGFQSLIHGANGALVQLGHVGMYNNNASDTAIWNEGSEFQIQHATIARNRAYVSSGTPPASRAIVSQGSGAATYLHNSIVAESAGIDLQAGFIQSECNLVDSEPGGLPAGTYFIDTPEFINIAGGDARQTSASPGVDMCLQNPLSWSSNFDIERQATGVNDSTNEQGNPGQPGGLYDAGFDENHFSVGDDHFTLTVARTGTGSGAVISVPLGIACGSDCTEDFFNGTLVELSAIAGTGSIFDGWIGCPLPNNNVCLIALTEDATVTAVFTAAGDEIFADRFESGP